MIKRCWSLSFSKSMEYKTRTVMQTLMLILHCLMKVQYITVNWISIKILRTSKVSERRTKTKILIQSKKKTIRRSATKTSITSTKTNLRLDLCKIQKIYPRLDLSNYLDPLLSIVSLSIIMIRINYHTLRDYKNNTKRIAIICPQCERKVYGHLQRQSSNFED